MMSPHLTCGLVLTLLVFAGPVLGATDYVVEVLCVLDQSSLDAWMRLDGVDSESRVREEITALFFEMNYMYHSFRAYGIKLEVRLFDIHITNERIIPTDDEVDMYDALDWFEDWLKQKGLTGWDHAMFMIHSDLRDGNDGSVIGAAYIDNVCEDGGISVIELGFYYGKAMTMAHELGHSLSFSHDDNYGNKECDGMPKDESYVMWPYYIEGTSGRWFFSPCSAQSLSDKLNDGSSFCLDPEHTTASPIVSRRMGEMLSAEQFCKREMDWADIIWPWSDEGDDLCMALDCWDGWFSSYDANSPEGLPCGGGKRCFMGRCIEAE